MIAGDCPAAAARMLSAGPVSFPASARLASTDLVVRVDVTVAPDGTVRAVRVLHSSGASDADADAVAAAKASKYAPATQDCLPVEGHYTYTATFAAAVKNSSQLPPAGRRLVY